MKSLAVIAFINVLTVGTIAEEGPFRVYESIRCQSKPIFSQLGVLPIQIVHATWLWERGAKWNEPDERRIRSVALKLKDYGNPIIVDVVHWSLAGDEKQAKENAERLTQMMNWFKEEQPELLFGYYGVLPVPNYRATQRWQGDERKQWKERNAAFWKLGQTVKVIFAPLYTFPPDRGAWKRYGKETLKEAKQYDKPVIVLLRPTYHVSNEKLKGNMVEGDYWEIQLDTCRKYADGIVISLDLKKDWDENADWWKVTKVFLKTLKD